MPFIAKTKDSNKEINILEYQFPRLDLQKGNIVCRFCGQEMYIRGGEDRKVLAHFVHHTHCKASVEYRRDQNPESAEHLLMKKILADELKLEFEEYSDATPRLEYSVKFGSVHRIIDVAMVFPMGWVIAHEIQLSAISIQDLEQRTNDYAGAGIDVVWWFGNKADTAENREWSLREFGSVFCLDTTKLSALAE